MSTNVPDKKQCQKFLEFVDATTEVEVKKYIQKAYEAYCDGHLEASVLLCWAGVERYTALLVSQVGKWYFDFVYNAKYKKDPLNHYTISQIDQLAGRSRFFCDRLSAMSSLRELRHQLAHGTGRFLSENEPEEFYVGCDRVLKELDIVRESILLKKVADEKLSEPNRLASANICFLNEKFTSDASKINNLLQYFPDDTDWENFSDTLIGNLSIEIEEIWRADEASDDDKKSRYRNLTIQERIGIQNSYFDQVSAFLNAAFLKYEIGNHEGIWNKHIKWFLDEENFELLIIDNQEGAYGLLQVYFKILNLMHLPLRVCDIKIYTTLFNGIINALDSYLNETNLGRISDLEQEKHQIACLNLNRNLSKIQENIPPKEELRFESIREKFNTYYNTVFPRKE